ncbi:hypothetical protein ACFLTO_02710 [Chloroflexota bacterium]
MFKWLGQQFEKSKLKTGQMQQRELNDDLVTEDSTPQQTTSDPLSKRAEAVTEQLATSIKTKALAEAEAETSRIISQAKLEAQEIIDRAEIDAQEIIATGEITKIEAKQEALQRLIRVGEEMEKEIEEETKRKTEETQ